MVDFVNTQLSAVAVGAGTRDSGTATLSQLEKCKRQLGDWQACPSGKTPEGQRIIENLRAQISRLESRTQQATPKALKPAEAVKPAEVLPVDSARTAAAFGIGGRLEAWA